LKKARFGERPNRFLVHCLSDSGEAIEAYLPNPGRLWELLFPGVILYLTDEPGQTGVRAPSRKTQHTVLAVERDGEPIFLHTHLTNRVARFLLENKRIPGLEGTEVARAEVPVGNSRFDFLLDKNGSEIYLEVKSCTLFGNGTAMFPDAVTERGRRHLLELETFHRKGLRPVVLFLVHTQRVTCFMPDYHTDLAFSQALLKVRNKLQILPVAIGWKPDLTLEPEVRTLEIPWSHLRQEVKDRGSYLLILKLEKTKQIEIGRLDSVQFREGYYLYVGSAMRNLSARIARHCRKRKKLHWHIDFLGQEADEVVPLPIRSSQRQECEIADAFLSILQPGPDGFGSSDCQCLTHLFWHPTNPLDSRAFHDVLQRFRMRTPDFNAKQH
jgi:sugar fermentation stimulation protein A